MGTIISILDGNMKKIDVEKMDRRKIYEWFKTFKNPTYGVNVNLDVTKLVKYTKETNSSFFINFLFILVKSLNDIPEMKQRFVDGESVKYDVCNPGITVLTKNDTFENVRFSYVDNYHEFYSVAKENIDKAKNEDVLTTDSYNLENTYNEYYITSVPWINFTSLSHPIPEDVSSLSVPRICFGKFVLKTEKYEMPFNITVSHVFVDGFHISKFLKKIEGYLDNVNDILR